MSFDAIFGLKTDDIEQAKDWLEETLEIPAQGRQNDEAGDYYSFGKIGGEYLRLYSGTSEDEDGEYPTEHDFPDESLILYLDESNEDSAILKALESRQDRFEKLREDRFDD